MKLGIIERPAAAGLEHAKSLGLDFVEFDCNYPAYFGRPMAEILPLADEIKAASERTGVEVGAVGRWASQILDENGDTVEEEWNEVKSVIDFGQKLGAKFYLCSVNLVPTITYYKNITCAIRVLRDIVAYAEPRGMKCAIVNCMMGDNFIRTPNEWKLVLDEVPGLGIKYDPSHSFVHGGEHGAYLKEAMEWGDRFTYCHVKGVIQLGDSEEPQDWEKYKLLRKYPQLAELPEFQHRRVGANPRYDNPPAGIDSINWRAFFAALYQHDYDGYLSIEPHSSTWRGEKGEKGVKYTIKYIRDLML